MSDSPEHEARNTGQPTVGPSDNVDEGARLLFESWFPLDWKKRRQIPDIHIDYRIEIVEQGEPTGLNFQCQVKGRSIHKRKTKALAEPFKTKHLRYYMRCEEPVFLFLIDPATRKGHWLFVQRYLMTHFAGAIPRDQKTLTVQFDAARSFEHRPLFEKELRDALTYMRNMHPGSPMAAILAKQQRLEQRFPGHSIQIIATDKSMNVQVTPLLPLREGVKLRFLNDSNAGQAIACFEKGESFQVKASEIQLGDSTLLQEAGDVEVTIAPGIRLKGCLQIHFGEQAEPLCIQVDGEWVIAPKRISFNGQLCDSPLIVKLVREQDAEGKWKLCEFCCTLQWGAWEGQPLLALAYFRELDELFRKGEFLLRPYIRGHRDWPSEELAVGDSAKTKLTLAMDWLRKCKRAAQIIGVNAPFPAENAVKELESDDTKLLIKMLEFGSHEQSIAGEEVGLSGEGPSDGLHIRKNELTAHWTEPFRKLKFFGLEIPFGPLNHTWTDLKLVKTCPSGDNRTEMLFKGGSSSIWRIQYTPPDTAAKF